MLTCPFCQYQNPEDRGACDQCGQPLQRWYSLLYPHRMTEDPEEDWGYSPYLDDGQRYQRLGQPQRQWTVAGDRVITQRVLDCQPDQGSPLQDLQDLWLENPGLDPTTVPTAQVPPQAFPYLALQADYFPAVPELHDIIVSEDQTILLVEDRSDWPRLEDLWPAKTMDPLQQTQWLFEITLLWQALAPWQGQITLLNPDRLVLSPNHLLCLSYIDQSATTPNLPALGQTWQRMLLAEALSPALALQQLIQALAEGHLTPLDRLQEALAELAGQYRSGPTGVALDFTPDLSPDLSPDDGAMDVPPSDDELLRLAMANRDDEDEDASEEGGGLDLPTMVLPMKLISLEDAGQSHVGQQRNHNEDWFFCQTHILRQDGPQGSQLEASGLYILCDGMGGHASGEVASQLAVQTLKDYFVPVMTEDWPNEATIGAGVAKANQAIFNANQVKASSGLGRMGTTLVMALVQDLRVALVHVGDSRIYSYCKRSGLQQLTDDHEVGQREINRGVEPAIAYARPDAYQLTQALGPRDQEALRPGIRYQEVAEDTLFILCSDGLSDNNLLERHEASHIAPLLSSRANLEQGAADLIQLANEKNGHDNITLILVRLKLRPDLNQLPR
ncbi:MAG: serine/threonine phosphatase [Spirulina sp.]